jgi:hypothetical protein
VTVDTVVLLVTTPFFFHLEDDMRRVLQNVATQLPDHIFIPEDRDINRFTVVYWHVSCGNYVRIFLQVSKQAFLTVRGIEFPDWKVTLC